jgi:hypothetical protein
LEVGGLRLEAKNRVKLKVEGGKIEVERLRRWEGGPAAVGGLRFETGVGENRWTTASLGRGTMGVRGRESKARKLRRGEGQRDGRKENKPDKNYQEI